MANMLDELESLMAERRKGETPLRTSLRLFVVVYDALPSLLAAARALAGELHTIDCEALYEDRLEDTQCTCGLRTRRAALAPLLKELVGVTPDGEAMRVKMPAKSSDNFLDDENVLWSRTSLRAEYERGWRDAIEAATKTAKDIAQEIWDDALPSMASGADRVYQAIRALKPPEECKAAG